MHKRVDVYYRLKQKTERSLWSKYWNDNWAEWQDMCIGTVHRRGVDQKQAANYLLLEFWKCDVEENCVDDFN